MAHAGVTTGAIAEAATSTDFESVYETFSPYVAAIAARLLGRDSEVDDAVQEVFLAAMRAIPRLRDPNAIKGCLATITVRYARRRLRVRRARRWLGLDEIPDSLDVIATDAAPEQRSLLSHVYHLLDQLPASTRIAWTLRNLEGERLEDVAKLCGCSLATAKRRIAQAHRFIEGALPDE